MRRIVNISMPDSLFHYASRRAVERSFGSVSEYVRDLIRKDQRQSEELEIKKMESEALYHREVMARNQFHNHR